MIKLDINEIKNVSGGYAPEFVSSLETETYDELVWLIRSTMIIAILLDLHDKLVL